LLFALTIKNTARDSAVFAKCMIHAVMAVFVGLSNVKRQILIVRARWKESFTVGLQYYLLPAR